MAEDGYDPSLPVGPVPPPKAQISATDSGIKPDEEPQDQALTIGPLPGEFMAHVSDLTEEEKFRQVREKFVNRESGGGNVEVPKQREEWMLKPGEQKISAKNALKNRGFNCSGSGGTANAPIEEPDRTPAELDALQKEQERLQAEIDLYWRGLAKA